MGVPGAAYLSGICSGWIAVGLGLGTWANWHFVAKPLRKYTEMANNSLTLPDFLVNRCSTPNILSFIFSLISTHIFINVIVSYV